ncbi:hypothetical protein BH24ACT1_BH24ACT1_07200 [soil metagenome]
MSWSSEPAVGAEVDETETAVPAVRGDTVIAARAVAAIAQRAAGEVEGVELVSRSGLGRFLAGLLPGSGRGDGASAEVAQGSTALALHLSVGWPRPVGQVADAVRQHVQGRVSELTGYIVTEVDIVVDSLPTAGTTRTRRVA